MALIVARLYACNNTEDVECVPVFAALAINEEWVKSTLRRMRRLEAFERLEGEDFTLRHYAGIIPYKAEWNPTVRISEHEQEQFRDYNAAICDTLSTGLPYRLTPEYRYLIIGSRGILFETVHYNGGAFHSAYIEKCLLEEWVKKQEAEAEVPF